MSQDVDILLSAGGVQSKFESKMSINHRGWTHVCWIHNTEQDTLYIGDESFIVKHDDDKNIFESPSNVADSGLILGQPPSRIREGFSIRKMFQARDFKHKDQKFQRRQREENIFFSTIFHNESALILDVLSQGGFS